ncbi:MAG: hypothetical protein ACTTH5_02960 [Wolinella sp.]
MGGENKEPKAPLSEFDTSGDEALLEEAKAELEQSHKAIDKGFADYMSQNMSPELEELFFSDKRAFFEAIEAEKEKFIEAELMPKYERVSALSEGIENKKRDGALASAKQSFLSAHPEADFGAMSEFYQNELTRKQQQEISALTLPEQLEKVFMLMGGEKKSELPPHYEGGEVDSSSGGEFDAELPAFRN